MTQTTVDVSKIKDYDAKLAIDSLAHTVEAIAGQPTTIELAGSSSGVLTLQTAAAAGTNTLTLPAITGNALATAGTVSATTGLTATKLKMLDFRTVAGVSLAAAASSGIFGITYTPGTTAVLVTEAANSNTKTDVACIDVVLPPWYIAATDITVTAHCSYTLGGGTVGTHTLACAAYLNAAAGTQGSSLVATSAQTVPASDGAVTFTITGATLVPGSYLSLKFTLVIQDTGGSNVTANLNSVSFT